MKQNILQIYNYNIQIYIYIYIYIYLILSSPRIKFIDLQIKLFTKNKFIS